MLAKAFNMKQDKAVVSKKEFYEAKKREKGKLTPAERQEIKDKFGEIECAIFKDKDGYYCTTHRAASKSYPTIKSIPKSAVERISDSG